MENKLIELLSEESDKMQLESFDEKNRFDIDLCAWKDITPQNFFIQKNESSVNRFRIRTVASKANLSRSNSNKSQLSTISSGNSRNTSPVRDVKNSKNILNVCSRVGDPLFPSPQIIDISFKKPPKCKKMRKPIKVFKIPNAIQDNNE